MKNWEEQIELPNKGSDIGYAYILKSDNNPIKCDKETLFEVIENDDEVKYVTTPQNDTYIIPGSDYETLQIVLRKKKSSIKKNLSIGLLYTLLFGGMILISGKGFSYDRTGKLYFLIFGVIPAINALYELFAIRRVNESNYVKECSELKFDFWINQKKVLPIFIITGVLILIALFQFITGLSDSIESVGLVKPKAFAGEYWRLLTCTLLHGSVLHILFNVAAIYVIGRMVIRITSLSYFAIVFLISGVLGSIFSLFFMPNATSVGASGGIMGLIGFILMISIKFSDNIPRNIIKSMLNTIVLVALIGISASDIIDNAAHGGGLIGGILIGFLLIRKRKNMIPYKPSLLINIFGIVSALILIGGIGIIIERL